MYPLDAVFDTPEDVPEEVSVLHYGALLCMHVMVYFVICIFEKFVNYFIQIKTNKRYAGNSKWTVSVRIWITIMII